jgi:hypothetical protein
MISGRWFKTSRAWSIVKDAMSALGFLTIVITIVEFFPSLTSFSTFLKTRSFLFLFTILSLMYAIIKNRPRNHFIFKINNRDIELGLHIGKFEDKTASIEGVVFPKLYKEKGLHLDSGVCVLVKGSVTIRNGETSLSIDELKAL